MVPLRRPDRSVLVGAVLALTCSAGRSAQSTGDSLNKLQRAISASAIAGVGLTLLASPAQAKGDEVGGVGEQYFLNDSFNGAANRVLVYGEGRDRTYVGDWDGNGTDTLMLRRGNTFFVRNSNTTGGADSTFTYGDAGDTVLVGDWDGNGTDTLAVRRGGTYHVKNTVSTGYADTVFSYGDPGDRVLVGDWDGDDDDTLVVRRGGRYFVKNDLATGYSESDFYYGNPGDTVLVGHWAAAQKGDALGVRCGGMYHLRNSLTSGPADTVFGYGNPGDTAFVGDWNGDGIDSLGVRRPTSPIKDVDCPDFASTWDAQAYFDYYYPSYGDVARLDADNDMEACESHFG